METLSATVIRKSIGTCVSKSSCIIRHVGTTVSSTFTSFLNISTCIESIESYCIYFFILTQTCCNTTQRNDLIGSDDEIRIFVKIPLNVSAEDVRVIVMEEIPSG